MTLATVVATNEKQAGLDPAVRCYTGNLNAISVAYAHATGAWIADILETKFSVIFVAF